MFARAAYIDTTHVTDNSVKNHSYGVELVACIFTMFVSNKVTSVRMRHRKSMPGWMPG